MRFDTIRNLLNFYKYWLIETVIEKQKLKFVETIPSCCEFDSTVKIFPNTGESIIKMIKKAKLSIEAISFYFTLRDQDVPGGPYPSSSYGETIYNELVNAIKRGYYLNI